MKIFVTGATGFIGQHLLQKLSQGGNTIFALVKNEETAQNLSGKNIVPVFGRLENPESYKHVFESSVDAVFHLAAIPGQKWSYGENEYSRVNVRGTADLLELCCKKTGKFIFTSSINVLNSDNSFLWDEYGKSKFQAEKIVSDYARRGLKTVILRPSVVYGPGDTGGMILKLCQLIEKKKFRLVGSGKNVIPFVHIDDLIQAFVKSLESESEDQVYEITGPDNPPFRKVVRIISEILKKEFPRLAVPAWCAYTAALFSEGVAKLSKKEPLITRHQVDILTRHRDFSPKKAIEELGYRPQKTLFAGFQETIHWYKENGYL